MAVKQLKKEFRLKWKEDKTVPLIGKFKLDTVTGCSEPCADFDTLEEMKNKVDSEELILTNEQKKIFE